MNARAFRRVALLPVSAAAAVLLIELALRVFYPQTLTGWWMVNHPSGLVLNRAEGKARHAFRDIAVTYTFGKHHNRTVVGAPAAAASRIILMGDSFAFGWLVADGQTLADRLQQRFPDHEVLNVAVGGWGTADHVKFVELFCSTLRPSMIYLVMNSLDIDRAIATPLYRLAAGGALVGGSEQPPVAMKFVLNQLPGYGWLLEHSHVAQLARASILSMVASDAAPPGAAAPDATPLGQALFRTLKDESDACGTRLHVFYTGWPVDMPGGGRGLTHRFVEQALAEGFFDRHGIAFHELARTSAMATLFRDRFRYTIAEDGHPNAAGAELLYRALTEVDAAHP